MPGQARRGYNFVRPERTITGNAEVLEFATAMGEPAKRRPEDPVGEQPHASPVPLDSSRTDSSSSLQSPRLQLAAIVESSDDAILSKDLDGIIRSWNQGAERLYGYSTSEVIGQHVSMLNPRGWPDDTGEIMRRLRLGERIRHYQTVRQSKSGNLLDISLTVSPIRDESGTIIGASTIGRDITAQKRTQNALAAAEKLAANGRIAAAVAHEINNPLEGVVNLLYLIEKHPSVDDTVRQYAHMAQEEVARVSRLAREALSTYRHSSEQSSVNVCTLLESFLDLFSHKIKARGVKLQRQLETSASIQSSAAELRQVLSNLVGNALDATPGGGTVKIRAYDSHSWSRSGQPGIRILIADSGHGIRPEDLTSLFSPFFSTKGERGTGLGLWVSAGIVNKYGGRIQVRSSVHPQRQGTSFMVFLPLTSDPKQSSQGPPRPFIVP